MKIEKKYNIIIKELQKLYESIKPFNKFVIGLSGGLDSSIVTTLCVQAIGKENVFTYYIKSIYNSEKTEKMAQKLAEVLDINHQLLWLDDFIKPFLKTIDNCKEYFPISEENLQARLRGLLLQTLASKRKSICISCSNKSELMLGYFTYASADDIGAIAPIGDLFKSEVFELGHYINKKMNFEIISNDLLPNSDGHIEVYPSAELSLNQKDPFDYIKDDSYLKDIENGWQPGKDCENKRYIELYKCVKQNIWKRKQCPPIISF